MYQIRLRLGLRPRPCWGSSQRSPRLPSWILGVLLLKGGRGGKGEERGKGREKEWRGWGGKRKGGRGGREGTGRGRPSGFAPHGKIS